MARSLKDSGNRNSGKPEIIPRDQHNVSRDEISKSALKVLYRLHKSGYQAFLVGGCVRDALVGLHPKDFDVATNATPEEVRALFSNCRLIGRRFRLAHVRFGREIIEVATFRAAAISEHDDHHSDDEGRILRDNVYGSIDEDVWRRDFTANALYYNIADFSIWDYTGGVRDVRDRVLRLIGDPGQRLREDPVRMLRAVRFAAKLDFRIADEVVEADPCDPRGHQQAIELYRGRFMTGFAGVDSEEFESWVLRSAEELASRANTAYRIVCKSSKPSQKPAWEKSTRNNCAWITSSNRNDGNL